MEDVKDTLWKWFVQASALAGLCFSAFALYSCAGLLLATVRSPPPGRELPPDFLYAMRAWAISVGLLLGPILGAVWLRMLLMRKWAAWVICVLGAWLTLTSLAFLPRIVVSALAAGLGPGASGSYAWRIAATAYLVALGCALVLRPKIWRDSL